jgi:hypothetical protein
MSGPDRQPKFALTLVAVPGSDVPAAIRLKRFLKAALRSYGLRCTEAREIHPPPAEPLAAPGDRPTAEK